MTDREYGVPYPIVEVKAAGDAWAVEGYASTYGNLDLGGDVVLKGAFDESLRTNPKVRFLLAHDQSQILGPKLELKSDDHGLFGRFKISKTPLGQYTHELLKDDALDSFSIGYIPVDFEFDDSGARVLKQVELLEVSVVAMAMNPKALVTGVKHKPTINIDDDVPIDELLKQIDDWLANGADEVKALLDRRGADERKLADRHIDAMRASLVAAEAYAERMIALLDMADTAPDLLKRKQEMDERRERLLKVGVLAS